VTDDELNKMFKAIAPPTRLPAMLASGQVEMSAQEISSFCSQALAKLFISEGLQESKIEG